MKKLTKALLSLILTVFSASAANAIIRYEDTQPKRIREVNITGFLDYAPFGWTQNPEEKNRGKFTTIYQSMLNDFQQENNLKLNFKMNRPDYDTLVQNTRSGEIDMILGMYHETLLYKGLDIVYPSIIGNPITIFMLPHRINEVKNINDLKKLKGIRPANELYSDFVTEKIKEYNLENAKTSYELFEKLFTGKVDYIMGGQYYVLIEAAKLGLRNKISTAKQALWDMPVFIGVSKLSPQRGLIMQKLTAYSEKKENRAKMQELLIQMINDITLEYQSIIPPTFGLEELPALHPQQSEDSTEPQSAPADEAQPAAPTKTQPAVTDDSPQTKTQ